MLKDLAELPGTDLPFLSVYLDWRVDLSSPGRVETYGAGRAGHEVGHEAGHRQSMIWFKDRLGELQQVYDTAEMHRRSFNEDVAKIEDFLHRPPDPAAKGLVAFACHDRGIFTTLELPVPVPNRFFVDDRPHIYDLARLPGVYGRYALVMAESDVVQVVSITWGHIMDVEGRQHDPADVRRHDQGGWSQARYQRHIDNTIMHFAKSAVDLIQDTMQRDRLDEIVLSADEPVRSELLHQMPEELRRRVFREEPILMDTPVAEAVEEVMPILLERQREKAYRQVAELEDRVGMGGAAAAGVNDVITMLNEGRVDTLILEDTAEERPAWRCGYCGALGEGAATEPCPYCGHEVRATDLREELVRKAVQTDADLTFVPDGGALGRWQGVGALLRF